MPESRVLLVDAAGDRADQIASLLHFIDYNPVRVASAKELDLTQHRPQDWVAVIVGQIADEPAWKGFLEWLRNDPLHPPVLATPEHHGEGLQGFGLDPDAGWAMDYPIKYAQLSELLRRASVKRLETDYTQTFVAAGPTGSSPQVQKLRRMIEQVAGFDTTVLVLGESGTGKEVVARAVHDRSARRARPFVAINCGAIPAELLESELFGHEKGAFTGAISARKGRFEMAEGGTLFLDEIGDMSLPMQVKLLRVLQERSYERVGSNRSQHCNVRVIAATHRNLEENIARGTFREDLFYRLNVFPIEMPPLRNRLDDLPELIADLVAGLERQGRGTVRFTAEAVRTLQQYGWPGNVRELANLIERLAVLHPGGAIRSADLPLRYRGNGVAVETDADSAPRNGHAPAPVAVNGNGHELQLPAGGIDLKEHIANIEISLIKQALSQSNGVVAHAAQLLGLRRTTLVEKLRKYELGRAESLTEV